MAHDDTPPQAKDPPNNNLVIRARSARSIPRARPDVRTEPYPRYGDRRTENESRGSAGGRDAND